MEGGRSWFLYLLEKFQQHLNLWIRQKKTQEIKTYQMHTVYLCNSVGISCTVVAIFANPSLRLKFPLKRDHSLVLKSQFRYSYTIYDKKFQNIKRLQKKVLLNFFVCKFLECSTNLLALGGEVLELLWEGLLLLGGLENTPHTIVRSKITQDLFRARG